MIYVASSWRNDVQPHIVHCLRALGLEVYDFRNPPSRAGFGWEQVYAEFATRGEVEPARFLEGLEHDLAVAGFASDMGALQAADAGVLVLPCGASAHLEAGWMAGAGKPLHILLPTRGAKVRPELMYKMADRIHVSLASLVCALREAS